jgi:signal peptide peptidase SppA
MTFAYGHIAQRLFGTPLMYDERKAEAFVHGIGGRISGSPVVVVNGSGGVDHQAFANGRPIAGRLGDFQARDRSQLSRQMLFVENNVAVIGIEGSLVHKGTFIGQSSGVTSYEGLQAQIRLAASPEIKAAVFEVDSFGGEVSGAFETAAMITQLSRLKPTIAILTDFAFSAAYLLASQTRAIIAPQFGGAGSIGAIMLHADYSGQLEKEGVKVTIIRAGESKALGNPYEPLPPDVESKWQAQAEEVRQKFAEVVAKARTGRITKAKALKTEAEAYDAKEALALGLIDDVADPTATYEAFVREVNRT